MLDLLAREHSKPSIAQRLVLSEKTVRNDVSDIFTKMNVCSRAEAVAVAVATATEPTHHDDQTARTKTADTLPLG